MASLNLSNCSGVRTECIFNMLDRKLAADSISHFILEISQRESSPRKEFVSSCQVKEMSSLDFALIFGWIVS